MPSELKQQEGQAFLDKPPLRGQQAKVRIRLVELERGSGRVSHKLGRVRDAPKV